MKKIIVVLNLISLLLGGCSMKQDISKDRLYALQKSIVNKVVEQFEGIESVAFKRISKDKKTGFWHAELLLNHKETMTVGTDYPDDLSQLNVTIVFDFIKSATIKPNANKNYNATEVNIIYKDIVDDNR